MKRTSVTKQRSLTKFACDIQRKELEKFKNLIFIQSDRQRKTSEKIKIQYENQIDEMEEKMREMDEELRNCSTQRCLSVEVDPI